MIYGSYSKKYLGKAVRRALALLVWSALAAAPLAFDYPVEREKPYPRDYFRSPVDGPLRLSGAFGELRPHHFHSGIDIKGPVGQPLYAAADGFVARIGVQAGGYGKVLYIDHPNGYTTVYAHLRGFTPDIDFFVKQWQTREQRYEVDIKPEKSRFTFKQGDLIGFIGLSGSTFGPHLHFEIRETETARPLNPLLFGLIAVDKQAPRMHQLKVYELDERLQTLNHQRYDLIETSKDYYEMKAPAPLETRTRRVGFALKAFDHMDGVPNKNGIYALSLLAGDSLVFRFEMDGFDFQETRYLNAHLDYEEWVTQKRYFHRAYLLPGNQLSLYSKVSNRGVIVLPPAAPVPIQLIAEDYQGNTSRLRFSIASVQSLNASRQSDFHYYLPCDKENEIDLYDLRLFFPAGTFYEDLELNYHTTDDRSDYVLSRVHAVHAPTTPAHHYFDIAIRPHVLPDDWRDKVFIAYCDWENRVYNCGGEWDGELLQTKARQLGDYCVMIDTIPPTIQPIEFQNNMKGRAKMTFRVRDNFPPTGLAPSLRYEASIDGQWILLEYDQKNNLLIHHFDDELGGTRELRLQVTDSQGNSAVFERAFLR
jgi:hypothetical protein